jgi:tetratricopeptide (TPR) repeat protein
VPSDTGSAPQFEPETTPEEYRRRAMLLADLGRYDEATGEIAAGLSAAPADAALLATLARVHLAAEQPAEALVAAERAVAAAPHEISPLVVRAMALADNLRYAEAAQVAGAILGRWPADAYAQRTGAALLSEARNGQEALNAAWNGVRIAPTDGEAHLVLAVVAARLRLFDLAQRAYTEALDLDEAIGEAQRDVGVVRLERRRWARALEALADEAALTGPEQEAVTEQTPVSRPVRLVLDRYDESAAAVRQAVLYGSNGVVVAAVLTAVMTLASPGASRVWAGFVGVLVIAVLAAWLGRRVGEPILRTLSRLRGRDTRLALAAFFVVAAPVLLVLYAAVGGLVPLISAMVVAAIAELLVLLRPL